MKGKDADGKVTLLRPRDASLIAQLGGGRAGGTRVRRQEVELQGSHREEALRALPGERDRPRREGPRRLDLPGRRQPGRPDPSRRQPADVAIPEPGENATVNGVEVDPQDVDEFIEEL